MAAESKPLDISHLQEILKPFYQRAEEAEQRLAKLEISFSGKIKDLENEKQHNQVDELQKQLENLKADKHSEAEKAKKEIQRLSVENAKLEYRIIHLIRALNEVDNKPAAASK